MDNRLTVGRMREMKQALKSGFLGRGKEREGKRERWRLVKMGGRSRILIVSLNEEETGLLFPDG